MTSEKQRTDFFMKKRPIEELRAKTSHWVRKYLITLKICKVPRNQSLMNNEEERMFIYQLNSVYVGNPKCL